MSQIDKLKEDSKIPIFKALEYKLIDKDTEGFAPILDEVIFKSKYKFLIFDEICVAIANGLREPYTILAPKSYLDKDIKYLTYPIIFLGNKLYFIEQITEVICLESK